MGVGGMGVGWGGVGGGWGILCVRGATGRMAPAGLPSGSLSFGLCGAACDSSEIFLGVLFFMFCANGLHSLLFAK